MARKAAKISPLRLEDEMICLNSQGEPWREGRAGYNGFISSFKKAKVEAGIKGPPSSSGWSRTRRRRSLR